MSFDEACEVSPQTFLITPTQKCLYNNIMTNVIFMSILALDWAENLVIGTFCFILAMVLLFLLMINADLRDKN